MLFVILIIGISAGLYRLGFRFMIQGKLFSKPKNELYAYFFFMSSGVTIGEYFSINWIPYFFPVSNLELVLLTTINSILIGEVFYNRNIKLLSRIITSANKE